MAISAEAVVPAVSLANKYLCTSPALGKYLQNMRLVSTAVTLLGAFYAYAQPANQGDVLACLEVETGAKANKTLVDNGLPPPNNPDLLVGFYCEPQQGITPCNKPLPSGVTCGAYSFREYCLCCDKEELIDSAEDFTGFVGVDCVAVFGT
ncbi:hypothetical protein BJV78DRAFT_1157187 [Lactifluus subvellereus]|nr:hypothetical protein BJV78DRAFT_1157187 [Lactifluus subvellereus]